MRQTRDRYHSLLNTTAWRSLRKAHLGREPFCHDCATAGVLTPATEVHHITPVATVRDPERMRRMAFDPHNLVGLCHACHVKRHESMGKGTAKENARRQSAAAREFMKKFYGETPGGDFSEAPPMP